MKTLSRQRVQKYIEENRQNALSIYEKETLADLKNFKNFLQNIQLEKEERLKKMKIEKFFYQSSRNEKFLSIISEKGENLAAREDLKEIILRLSQILTKNVKKSRENSLKLVSTEISDTPLTLEIVKLLRMLCLVNPYVILRVPSYEILRFLIGTMKFSQNEKLFKNSLKVIECFLVANNFSINMNDYPFLINFIAECSPSSFNSFLRICALLVLESDKTDFLDLKTDFNHNLMIKNHCFLINSTSFIERTFDILYNISESICALSRNLTFEDFITQFHLLHDEGKLQKSGVKIKKLLKVIEQKNFLQLIDGSFLVDYFTQNSNLTEVLFVLSNLLTGKKKTEIQDLLSSLGIVEKVLNPLFDLLFDQSIKENRNLEEEQNSPSSTTRIQLLRIVINFCDRDSRNIENKSRLVTPEENEVFFRKELHFILGEYYYDKESVHELELQETDSDIIIKMLNEVVIEPPNHFHPRFQENAFQFVKSKGLINKISHLLQEYSPNSIYRFWFASCVESFLRGSYPMNQIFVACTGLLHMLIKQIICKNITKPNNIQISYDLLGEIIKYNKINIILLTSILKHNTWEKRILEEISTNVVDSNVFLRALLLSFKKFDFQQNQQSNVFLNKYVYNFSSKLEIRDILCKTEEKWLYLLLSCVEKATLNPDNICCINTALIIFIFSDCSGDFNNLMKALVCMKYGEQNHLLSDNIMNLLKVWDNYYQSRTKDIFGLQFSTNIPFHFYKKIKQRVEAWLLKNKVRE